MEIIIMIKRLITVTSIAAVLTVMSPAHAGFGKIKVPGTSKSESSTSSSTAVDATAAQEAVVKQYQEASGLVLNSQAELSEALGLKSQAAELRAEAESMGSGATLNKDSIEATTALSARANASIQEKIESGEPVSAEGREHYVNGLSLYAQGVVATKDMTEEASAFSSAAKDEIGSASMTEKHKVTARLSAGTYLVKELPGFTSKLANGLGQVVAYAESADIPVPKEATDVLAGFN